MVFPYNPSTPRRHSGKLQSLILERNAMIDKICETETNKELINHYDRMKPCRLPPGDFRSPTNIPHVPMQLPIETSPNSSTAKCCSCSSEGHLNCIPKNGPVQLSCSVQTVQPTLRSTFASPLARMTLPSALLEEETFPNCSHDSTLPSFSQVPETVTSPNCSSRPTFGTVNRHSFFV